MEWMRTCGRLGWAVGLLLAFGWVRTAAAIYLDDAQNFSVRGRFYSQFSLRAEDSQVGTDPTTKTGQLVQNRNYYNPEMEAKLTSYTTGLKGTAFDWLAPDDFSFRIAGWGFYDGIYDYGADQFNKSQGMINSTFHDFSIAPKMAWILEGNKYDPTGTSVATIFPRANAQQPRDIYAHDYRVNELYLNYSKGPVFVRLGRQFISWGESDTVALLDVNNPFDQTLGAPGVFQDIEEARIPLWTLRSSVTVFDTLGPLSSGFVEGYWVPGNIDTNTGYLPIRTASPYSPRGPDPQTQVPTLPNGTPLINAQFVLLDRTVRKTFGNSQYGFRVQSVVNRSHTVSAWFYQTLAAAPVPQSLGLSNTRGHACGLNSQCITTTQTVHPMTGVVGLADSFYLEPVDGIIRAEAEYFIGEPAFIPQVNLNITNNPADALKPITTPGQVPKANYLRWELGYDRFFFLRALNPTNSFTLVGAVVGSWNLDATSLNGSFKQNGQFKPEFLGKRLGTVPTPDDFVDQKVVETFAQVHLQTDYLHGRLSPSMTYIQYIRGTWALLPSVTYRWTDWLLFQLAYVNIGGEYQQIGFFNDRSQISLRATYQLN
jgi:hypothetical protein